MVFGRKKKDEFRTIDDPELAAYTQNLSKDGKAKSKQQAKQQQAGADPTNSVSYKAGHVVGKGLGAVGTVANKTGVPQALSRGMSKVGDAYENKTGRDAGQDGKVATTAGAAVACVGAAVATVVVAAPAVVVGAAVGAGALGGAAVARAKGHGDKVDTVGGAFKKGANATASVVKNTFSGLRAGASGKKPALADAPPPKKTMSRSKTMASPPHGLPAPMPSGRSLSRSKTNAVDRAPARDPFFNNLGREDDVSEGESSEDEVSASKKKGKKLEAGRKKGGSAVAGDVEDDNDFFAKAHAAREKGERMPWELDSEPDSKPDWQLEEERRLQAQRRAAQGLPADDSSSEDDSTSSEDESSDAGSPGGINSPRYAPPPWEVAANGGYARDFEAASSSKDSVNKKKKPKDKEGKDKDKKTTKPKDKVATDKVAKDKAKKQAEKQGATSSALKALMSMSLAKDKDKDKAAKGKAAPASSNGGSFSVERRGTSTGSAMSLGWGGL